MKRLILLFFLSTSLFGCRNLIWGTKIPIIGLNKNGQEVVHMVPMKIHSHYMSEVINETSENISSSLKDYGQNSPWELSRVDLNVILTFGFSLADVVGMEISPGVRLQYVKK